MEDMADMHRDPDITQEEEFDLRARIARTISKGIYAATIENMSEEEAIRIVKMAANVARAGLLSDNPTIMTPKDIHALAKSKLEGVDIG